MRILTEPKVYIVARPQIVQEHELGGLQQFLSDNDLRWPTPTEGVSDGSTLIEVAGRECYMSFGNKAGSKTNQGYVDNLLGRKKDGGFKEGPAHGSVCEHPHYSFIIAGAGRGYSHEQVRHRPGVAYSQLSTRYCDFEREDEEGTWEPGFCIPPLMQLSEEAQKTMREKLQLSQRAYKELLYIVEDDLKNNKGFMANLEKYPSSERKRMLRKAARGAARDILPIATEAIMVMTANARAIWNMTYLRGSVHAEGVIRAVYVQLIHIMQIELPELFYGIQFETLWDGSTAVTLPRDKL